MCSHKNQTREARGEEKKRGEDGQSIMSDNPTSSNRRLDDQEVPNRNVDDHQELLQPPVPLPSPTVNNDTGGGLLSSMAFALERSISAAFFPERAAARERLRAQQEQQQQQQQQLSSNDSSCSGTSSSIHRSASGAVPSRSKVENGGLAHRELRPSSSFRTVASDEDDDDNEQRSCSSNVVEWTLNGPKEDKNLATGAAPLYFPPLDVSGEDTAAAADYHPPDKEKQRRRSYCWFVFAFLLLALSGAGALAHFLLSRHRHQQQSMTSRSEDGGGGQDTAEQTDKSAVAGGPTTEETTIPTEAPTTMAPVTAAPTTGPTSSPTRYPPKVVKFAALGDVPYTDEQHEILREQMEDLNGDEGLDFVIHVGDIRQDDDCRRSEYEDVAETFRLCRDVPVFVIKGDNDAWDCTNYEQGLEYWADSFDGFTSRHWDLPFTIERMRGVPENFAFEYKDVLFIGVDIPGGEFEQSSHWWAEWESHLEVQIVWVLGLMRAYDLRMGRLTGRVVLFGHADPNEAHKVFFDPLTRFLEETGNRIPVLYVNGDGHEWSYDPGFYDTKSLMRIMVRGEGAEPPVIIRVLASGDSLPVDLAFEYDRQL